MAEIKIRCLALGERPNRRSLARAAACGGRTIIRGGTTFLTAHYPHEFFRALADSHNIKLIVLECRSSRLQ